MCRARECERASVQFELVYSVDKGARGQFTGVRNMCMIWFSVMPGARNVCMGVPSFMSVAFTLNGRVKFFPFRTGAWQIG